MEIANGHRALARPLRAPAITIGNFDGVHRGHRALLDRARELARAGGGEACVLTFEPHPAAVLAPERAPARLTPLARKLELLADAGIDVAVVEPFTRELSRLSPDAFERRVLAEALGARHIVVGADFRYGARRGGDIASLRAAGDALGFGVEIIEPVTIDGEVASSSAIRGYLAAGELARARALLGRDPDVDGTVVRGAGRGRQIGVPTANLEVEGQLLPATGIYAVWVEILGRGGDRLMGAASLGVNPTFGPGGPTTTEVHLLDYEGDLYGQRLRVYFCHRLRGEERFDSVEELVSQIRRDIERTRSLLAGG